MPMDLINDMHRTRSPSLDDSAPPGSPAPHSGSYGVPPTGTTFAIAGEEPDSNDPMPGADI